MKTKLLSFLILLFSTVQSFSQPYVPMLNNSSWAVDVVGFLGIQTFTIGENGTQTVGAYSYKKYTTADSFSTFLLREDTTARKVYKVDYLGNDTLLFDFSLQVNDITYLANGQLYTVTSITTINVNGGQRRQFTLHSATSPFNEIWVEGVGSKEYPLLANYELLSDPVYYLKCSFQNGVNVYNQGLANGGAATDCMALGLTDNSYTKGVTFAPNPFQSELVITSAIHLENASLKMYNSIGQLVTERHNLNGTSITLQRGTLTNGMYFIQLLEKGKPLSSGKVLLTD